MRLSFKSSPSLLVVLGLPLLAEAMALHKDSSGEHAMAIQKRAPSDLPASPASQDGGEENYGWSGRGWKKAIKRDDYDLVSRDDVQRRNLLDVLGLGDILGSGNDQTTSQPVETPNNQDTSSTTGDDDEENPGMRGWVKRQDGGNTNDDTSSSSESDGEVNYGWRVWTKRDDVDDSNSPTSPPSPIIAGEGNYGNRAWVKREESNNSKVKKKLVKLVKRDDENTNKVEKNLGPYRGF